MVEWTQRCGGRTAHTKGETTSFTQLKLPVYQVCGATPKANRTDQMVEKTDSGDEEQDSQKEDEIMAAIGSLKTEFSSRFDRVMAAIENTRKEIKDSNERVSHTEEWISSAEDEVIALKTTVQKLELQNKNLEDKLLDLEARSRLNNVWNS